MALTPTVLAICLGALVMVLALVRVRSVLDLLDGRTYRRYWLAMAGLVALFLVGYLAAAGIAAVGRTDLFQLLVGAVFLAGAVFVFIVVEVGYLSIQDLERSRSRLADRESELERLYEVTDVLNRVLRHNLRNTMNVIIGRSELARNRVESEHEHHMEAIERIGEDLVETSRKARDIKEAIDADTDAESVSSTRLVEGSIERVAPEFPAVTFERDLAGDYHIDASTLLFTALEHVVDNAARHNDAADPRITVAVRADTETVSITVRDNGPGIPDPELTSLDESNERPLEHGSGLGLWVVRWILEMSGGRATFDDADDGGTVVTLTAPRANDPDTAADAGRAGSAG
jgi:signal transduction histidine kinase